MNSSHYCDLRFNSSHIQACLVAIVWGFFLFLLTKCFLYPMLGSISEVENFLYEYFSLSRNLTFDGRAWLFLLGFYLLYMFHPRSKHCRNLLVCYILHSPNYILKKILIHKIFIFYSKLRFNAFLKQYCKSFMF